MASDNTANPTASTPPPAAESTSYDEEEPLFHISLNPSKPQTIVLLHGLLSSHVEWTFVIPHLSNYHLLLVDLPGHGRSAHLSSDPQNLTIPAMADRVASLIRRFAHPRSNTELGHGVAHIVGLSMGGFVTLDLARRYPALCLTAFVTGAAPFEGLFAFMARYPSIVYSIMWTCNYIPDGLYWWIARQSGMKRVDELREEQKRNLKWEVIRSVYGSILRDCSGEKGWGVIRGLDEVRMVNVAGEKHDDLGSSRRIKEVWRETGILERLGSRVVVVRGAVHAWNLQMPEVFAEGIVRWVGREELPGEFEDL